MPIRRLSVALIVCAFTAGCPKRNVLGQVPPVPETGNQEARRRFQEQQDRFERDGVDVTAEMEIIAREYRTDPVAPYALLYAGISSLRAARYDDSLKHLDALRTHPKATPEILARGQLYRGIALNYLGQHAEAISALRAAEDAVNRDDQNEQGQWLQAMAVAYQKTGRPALAIRYYDDWFQVATDAEKALVVAQVKAIADGLPESALESAYRALESRDGPGAAFIGSRLVSVYTVRGDTARADAVRKDIAQALSAIGEAQPPEVRAGQREKLGALLPLSGRRSRIGERSRRGLTLAAEGVAPFQLQVKDSASAEAALDALADDDVIAVVGPLDSDAATAAGRRAGDKGVPMLSLSPRGGQKAENSRYVFHFVHSAEARARALARYALAKDIKDFAILSPNSAYGRVVGGAFADEVTRGGGRVVVRGLYPENATSFTDAVAQLRKPWRAVFIPDQAKRVALVTPALAAANYVARPIGEAPARSGPRKIVVLSTVEGADDVFVRNAGRYVHGGILAPGFYADRRDEIIGPFVASFTEKYSAVPTSLEAYAYDAVTAVAQALRAGANDREEVASHLGASTSQGLTGEIRFDGDHDRADDGVFFTTEQSPTGEFEMRAIRP
jgi:ABC-type branched-subunit amino acid transport system substrate-binding protein